MFRLESRPLFTKQLLTLMLGGLLGLAIFISPYQLHNNPGSIFTKLNTSSHQHHLPQPEQMIECLRCVLYGFQIPETIVRIATILVVLGFITFAQPTQPSSFITPSKSARAPPVHL
jgi:hypothetical protein